MSHTQGCMTTDEHEHDMPDQNIELMVGNWSVATVGIDDAPVRDFNTMQQANAHRIVACWNALEKLDTTTIEALDAEALAKAALQMVGQHPAPCARHCEASAFQIELRRIERLEKERGLLLASAKKALGVFEAQGWVEELQAAVELKAVIVAVEGKQ